MGTAFEKNLRQSPPRRIDAYTQTTILLSGLIQQMGWFFLGFGMIFVILFLPFSDWRYSLTRGPWEVVEGEVIAAEATNNSVNDRLVWEYGHRFSLEGIEYTGRSFGYQDDFTVGQKVPVQVNTREPWISKIQGTRTGAFPKFIIVVLIFPLAGVGMIIPGLRRQAKSIDLLRNGAFTRGKLREKEPTGATITINNRSYPVYKFVFDFEYLGATYQSVCKTHVVEPLEDEDQETILFYPDDPSFNVVYDGISSSPKMDAMGNFIPASWTAIRFLLAPAFGIFMLTLGALLLF